MTQLARNNLQMDVRVARKTFTAKCGHKVRKGERYIVVDDYFAYRKYHNSECMHCALLKNGIIYKEAKV